jgi:PAS domain S-box-containing protein
MTTTDEDMHAMDYSSLVSYLEQERSLLQAVMDQMPSGLYIAEAPSGKILLRNKEADRLLGHPPVARFSDYGAVHRDGTPYRREEYPLYRAVRLGETVDQAEMIYRRPDGDVIRLSVSAAPVRNEAGNTKVGVLVFSDITAQKKAEEERARLAAIVQTSDDAITRQNLSGMIIDWNPAAEKIYGFSAAEVLGRHIGVILPPHIKDEGDALIRQVCRGGIVQAYQTVRRTKTGRDIDMSITMSAIHDPAGKLRAVSTIERDITRRVRAQQELQRSREELKLATEAGGVGIWNYDLENETAHWNDILYRLLGLSPRPGPEAMETFFSYIHPDDRCGCLADSRAIMEQDEIDTEFRIVRADGRVRWLAAKGRVYRDKAGRPVRMSGINYDVTERKRTEIELAESRAKMAESLWELAQVNAELSEYAYAASHDLKAPLRAVRNYADFLYEDLAGSLKNEQKQYLDGLKRAVQQGETLINDLLAFSRIGRVAREIEPVDLDQVCREVRAVLDVPADAEIVLAEDWPEIRGDRALLRQILQNLMSNAVKFCSKDRARIEVGWRPAANRRFEIFVRDNGIGIDPRFHEQIFGIFRRLYPDRQYEGTGIGLAIVKKAAGKLGGTVRVESTPGRGSTFYVNLPLDPPHPGGAEFQAKP